MEAAVHVDTTCRYAYSGDDSTPTRGRLLIGSGRVILATSPEKTRTISTDAIFDVTSGQPPPDEQDSFGRILTIGYETDGRRWAVTIEPDTVDVEACVNRLFVETLSGLDVVTRHPLPVRRQSQQTSRQKGTLTVSNDGLTVETDVETIRIPLESVIGFEQEDSKCSGEGEFILNVRHLVQKQVVRTELGVDEVRSLYLLGRYLQLPVESSRSSVSGVDLSTEQASVLQTLYGGASLESSIDDLELDSDAVLHVLATLSEQNLVSDVDDPTLTKRGYILADVCRQENTG